MMRINPGPPGAVLDAPEPELDAALVLLEDPHARGPQQYQGDHHVENDHVLAFLVFRRDGVSRPSLMVAAARAVVVGPRVTVSATAPDVAMLPDYLSGRPSAGSVGRSSPCSQVRPRISRFRQTCVVLALLLGFAAAATPVAQAAEPVSSVETAQKKKKKKKKKPVKCKRSQVKERVKVGKRKRTRCVAAKRAWPAPKPVDMRTESTSYVLDANFSKLRDRRGRKAKSLPKLLKRIHPRAERALERATRAGLARMDTRAGASQSGRGCTEQPTGTVSSTFNAGGGQSVDLTMTSGPEASLQLGLESNQGNRRVRLEVEFPGCESHSFESCPTADGVIRGKDNRRISVRAWVYEGNTVVWSQGIRLDGETTLRGVVDDNAKLDFMEPHNTEVGTLTLGGSSRGFSPMSIRMLVQRITRVEFPERSFQLGPSIVNATITSPDLSGAALTAVEREIERDMREQADQQFRDIIAKAIEAFVATETEWNRANACASIDFTPAPNTKTLHRGEQGGFDARTNAKPGGSPGARHVDARRLRERGSRTGQRVVQPCELLARPPVRRRLPDSGHGRRALGLEGGCRAGDLDAADRGRPFHQPHRGHHRREAELPRLDLQLERDRHLRPRIPRAVPGRVLHPAVGSVHGHRVRA